MIPQPVWPKPGEPLNDLFFFVDHHLALDKISRHLRKCKSCAVIGGSKMGKTSILNYIRHVVSNPASEDKYQFRRQDALSLPIYFEPEVREYQTAESELRSIYRKLMVITISQCRHQIGGHINLNVDKKLKLNEDLAALESDLALDKQQYQISGLQDTIDDYDRDLHRLILIMRGIQDNIILLFLFDNLYRIQYAEVRRAVAEHWLTLVTSSYRRTYLRPYVNFIITCFKDHIDYFFDSQVDLPGDHLTLPVDLEIFKRNDLQQMLQIWASKVETEFVIDGQDIRTIYDLSGGHPYVSHRIIYDIFVEGGNYNNLQHCVEALDADWRQFFETWYQQNRKYFEIEPIIINIIKLFREQREPLSRTHIKEILRQQEYNDITQVTNLIRMLKGFGLIEETGKDAFCLTGHYCREHLGQLSMHLSPVIYEGQNMRNINITLGDRKRFREILENFPGWMDKNQSQRKAFLRMVGLSNGFVNQLEFTGSASDTDLVISQLERLGFLGEPTNCHALGLLTQHMLDEESGILGEGFLAQFILYYELIRDPNKKLNFQQNFGYIWYKADEQTHRLEWPENERESRWHCNKNVVELEQIFSKRAPFIDVTFLERGMELARTVCRVESKTLQAMGTGFLVAPDLLLTNHHVVSQIGDLSNLQIRFGYRLDVSGRLKPGEIYGVEHILKHSSSAELDFALLKVAGSPGSNPEIGFAKVAAAKIAVDDPLFIVQHPLGAPQKVVLQDNWVTYVAQDQLRVQYLTNTEYGSSGSPVCDSNWAVIALHHSRAPIPETTINRLIRGNEGIPMAVILPEIQEFLG